MRPLQAHCLRGLGTLYTRLGQREQARAALAAAIALYRTMDMTFWLPQAEATLAQVEGGEWPRTLSGPPRAGAQAHASLPGGRRI